MLAPKNNTNWISVEDRMPQEGKDVLVYVPICDKVIVAYYYQGSWSDTIPTVISNYWKVSHWQELPEKPQTDKAWIPAINETVMYRDLLFRVTSINLGGKCTITQEAFGKRRIRVIDNVDVSELRRF